MCVSSLARSEKKEEERKVGCVCMIIYRLLNLRTTFQTKGLSSALRVYQVPFNYVLVIYILYNNLNNLLFRL